MSVIPFKRPELEQQHGAGQAFCIGCRHEWAAAAPTGTTQMECPACHAHLGRWKFEFYPAEGQMVRECGCGNQLFYLTPDGHLCANCGIYQRY
ncbi:hypothetical protein AcdelDRAFT_0906 [Acidovorax delafieldii 2AN]|uniref:Uncharacterized protein n=1 Tax=Acidovorax delafieldii 2AN TaxID=573060 RepID=C5T1X6_ACIDE|nr:hypothetical protein [Acidovorax delafieldii]EER61571.1 hypothetical protein AcdelDRAFT_0906 [Acidovorax delafieldii 2AN]